MADLFCKNHVIGSQKNWGNTHLGKLIEYKSESSDLNWFKILMMDWSVVLSQSKSLQLHKHCIIFLAGSATGLRKPCGSHNCAIWLKIALFVTSFSSKTTLYEKVFLPVFHCKPESRSKDRDIWRHDSGILASISGHLLAHFCNSKPPNFSNSISSCCNSRLLNYPYLKQSSTKV